MSRLGGILVLALFTFASALVVPLATQALPAQASPVPMGPATPDPVTITQHADLGFTTSQAVDVDTGVANPPCLLTVVVCLFHGAAAFHGTLTASVTLGTDVSLTYNPADLNTPGGPVPVSISYTPTPNGSTVSYALTGNATFNFDGCSNCPATTPFNVTSAPNTFTAPMGSDSPITIPGSSTPLTLSVAGLKVITASIGGGLTLAPAGPGLFPGLGGAAALVSVTGASGAPVLPIEWDTSGSSQNFTLTAPATPTPLGISLGPIFHWLSTSGNAQINLHWTSDFQTAVQVVADIVTAGVCAIPTVDCSISDPSPISLFNGGLGPVYQSAGLDTEVGNAIGGVAGPLVAARVAAGFIPVPLTSPPLSPIPPLSTGSVNFAIPAVSITGAPAGVVLNGDSVNLTASASGGVGPYTYAWMNNGVPFATTQSITDTPALGDTNYAVTVTDSLGAVSNTATTTVSVYDYAVDGSPTTLQTLTTGTNTYAVTETLDPSSSTTAGLPSIDLSVSGLPAGATPTFTPASGSAGGFSSTLSITTASAPAGTYGLSLIGTDGRALIGGSRSSSLTLIVLTPAQAIPNVITTIQGLHTGGVLNGGQENSLIVKLNHAIVSLTTKPAQPTGCNQLQSFVNEVNDYVTTGILTPTQAATLLDGPLGILAIMAAVPC